MLIAIDPDMTSMTVRHPPRRIARRLSTLLLLAGWGVTASAQTVAASGSPAGVPPSNCVGDDPLPMSSASPRAWLNESDRDEVLAALIARYPMLQRDGLDAQSVLLWRHPSGDWRYAALIPDLRTAGHTCVAASFSAAVIAPTDSMLRKYFFASGESL